MVPAPGSEVIEPLEADELTTDTPEEVDDELGSGARPRQSGTTVRRKEHPLDRAAKTISAEIHGNARRLATDLFPSGPAGSERLSKTAFDAYVLRHWEEPEFRASLLDRLAPKGPDGKRLSSGVKQFNALYKDTVAPKQLSKDTKSKDEPLAFVPPGQATPEAAPPPAMGAPPPMPPTGPPPGPSHHRQNCYRQGHPRAAPPGLPLPPAVRSSCHALPPMMPPGLDAGMPAPPGPNVLPPG